MATLRCAVIHNIYAWRFVFLPSAKTTRLLPAMKCSPSVRRHFGLFFIRGVVGWPGRYIVTSSTNLWPPWLTATYCLCPCHGCHGGGGQTCPKKKGLLVRLKRGGLRVACIGYAAEIAKKAVRVVTSYIEHAKATLEGGVACNRGRRRVLVDRGCGSCAAGPGSLKGLPTER